MPYAAVLGQFRPEELLDRPSEAFGADADHLKTQLCHAKPLIRNPIGSAACATISPHVGVLLGWCCDILV